MRLMKLALCVGTLSVAWAASGKPPSIFDVGDDAAATRPSTQPGRDKAKIPVSTTAPAGVEVTVPATRNAKAPVATGVQLAAGQSFTINPNSDDKWNGGGTKKGVWCDYRGYPGKTTGWMAMMWKVGDATGKVQPDVAVSAKEAGELLLYC